MSFIDPDFPPVGTSLYNTNEEPLEGATGSMVAENRACEERIVWRRPIEFAPGEEYVLFHEEIEPEDIMQVCMGGGCGGPCSVVV